MRKCKSGCGGKMKLKAGGSISKKPGQKIVGMPGYNATTNPRQMKKGGTTFGMLSVKAGIDNNPKPTAADRIAGATKRKKVKKK
jgi:hypothetical protein